MMADGRDSPTIILGDSPFHLEDVFGAKVLIHGVRINQIPLETPEEGVAYCIDGGI
jgi:hypothetical protein